MGANSEKLQGPSDAPPRKPQSSAREAELVNSCLAGSQIALHELITTYLHEIQAGARRAIVRRGQGGISLTEEDLVQEFCGELLESPAKVLAGYRAERGGFGPWLATVVHRRCLNIIRSTGPSSPQVEVRKRIWRAHRDAAPIPPASHLNFQVKALLKTLPPESRKLLRAHFGLRPYRKPWSKSKIARRYGLTRRFVSKVIEAGIVAIRSAMRRSKG
jgi:RNA polymerase sigma factor (sigma-70 family)